MTPSWKERLAREGVVARQVSAKVTWASGTSSAARPALTTMSVRIAPGTHGSSVPFANRRNGEFEADKRAGRQCAR
jgi:hypothetical protein